MAKLAFAMSMLAGVTALCGAAAADTVVGVAAYVGDRAKDPEDETFAYVVKAQGVRPLAFVGPARNMGPVTGDAEKDTFAYRPLQGLGRDGQWSFVLSRACGVADEASAMDCRLPATAPVSACSQIGSSGVAVPD